MKYYSNILLFLFAIFFILLITASYYRFIVAHDYMVAYEGECDPYTQVCFVGCEDDECTSEYYYSQIEKYAPNVLEQCGKDITDCEKGYVCLPEDGEKCSITFCNPEVDGETCEELAEDDYVEEEDSASEYDGVLNGIENTVETEELYNNENIENI